MHKISFVFILFIFSGILLQAAEPEEIMAEGNKTYQAGNYVKAIELYEKVIQSGYESPSLYYNLGNAYYRNGKLGFAILNYERALKLSPGDEDIQHNLALANSKTVDQIETLPKFFIFQWWESALAFFTVTGWTHNAYFLYLAILAIIGFYFFDKDSKRQKSYFYSGLSVLGIFIIVVIFLSVKLNRELNHLKGVIVENEVTVKQSPDYGSTDAFVIHEGLKVNLEDKVDNWVKIRLQDGKVGWLVEENLKTI